MPARWILKTEPSDYSFDQLQRDGSTRWDGVGNNTALMHLRTMKAGDLALIYHTGDEKALIGEARIAGAPYPDPALADPRFVVVDLTPGRRLPRPVTLGQIKADARFAELGLVRISRLSVVPCSAAQWAALLELAGAGAGPAQGPERARNPGRKAK
ncbi:MAG: EVE domain-containing protein [Planctomycetes bacterium]|nr:EVE domain-containing protein [Planctomycetota bacterium]